MQVLVVKSHPSAKPLPRRGWLLQRGSALVEFAIVSPVAILLVMAIIQLGLMFSAKEVVNEAAFAAARAGAVQHAQVGAVDQDGSMTQVMMRGLVPFYQDTTTDGAYARLQDALNKARGDTGCSTLGPCMLEVQVLNPLPDAFDDFGVTSSASQGHRYIPNDNLEFRSHAAGPKSKISIQDANALKIKVTYGYPIKVPFMQGVIKAAMCGLADDDDCGNFYSQGRIPIVVYATVQMQTPAWEPDT
jgi:hypothetical protein